METALLTVLLFLGGQAAIIAGFYLNDRLTRNREVRLRLSDRKQQLYFDYMEFQTKLFKNTSGGITAPSMREEAVEFMRKWSPLSFLVASDEVVREWQQLQTTKSPQGQVARLARVLVAMRKDMGNVSTDIGPREALRTFIQPDDWNQIDEWLKQG